MKPLLLASTPGLAMEAYVAKQIQLHLGNDNCAKKLLNNYISINSSREPQVLFMPIEKTICSQETREVLEVSDHCTSSISENNKEVNDIKEQGALNANILESAKNMTTRSPKLAKRTIFMAGLEPSDNETVEVPKKYCKTIGFAQLNIDHEIIIRTQEKIADKIDDWVVIELENKMLEKHLKTIKVELQNQKSQYFATKSIFNTEVFKIQDMNQMGRKELSVLKLNELVYSIVFESNFNIESRKHVFVLTVNDFYKFRETSDLSLMKCLQIAVSKAAIFMEKMKSRACQNVIPEEMCDNLQVLVGVLELNTGISLNDLNVKFKKCLKKFSAKAFIEEKEYTSRGSHSNRESALKEILFEYLVNVQKCDVLKI